MNGMDVVPLLNELAALARAAVPAVAAVLFMVGAFFIARAGHLMWMGRDGRGAQDDVPIGAVLGNLLVGAALMQLNRTISNTRDTLGGFGTEIRSAMAYMADGAGQQAAIYKLALATAFAWLALLGICAVVRGLLMWRELAAGANRGGGDNLAWAGMWHILGGGILINIGFG
jgi:hypothetical protein